MLYPNKVPLEKGSFCFLTNLKNYLSYYNLKVSEPWLGGIIGYMGFYYTSKPIATNEVIHGRSGNFKYLFQYLQQQINKPLEISKLKTDMELRDRLKDMLDSLNIMLVWINDFYLEYSPYYNLSDFWSLVLLLMVNDSSVIIFDNGIKELSLETFIKAVNCNGESTFFFTREKILNWITSEKEVVIKGISRTISRFKSDRNNEGYYGDYGIELFIEHLGSNIDSTKIYNLYFQMNRPGGLSLTRENMKEFCIEIEQKGFVSEIGEIKDIYTALTDHWRKIASLLFKLSNSRDSDLKDRIMRRIFEAREYERKGIKAWEILVKQMKGEIK